MDTLRKLAEIPGYRFKYNPANNSKTVLSVQSFLSGEPIFKKQRTDESILIGVLGQLEKPPSYNTAATFTLVCIPRDRDENLIVEYDVFMKLFKYFKIEQRFLHLVLTNRYGLHYDREGDVVSYYIGTGLYTIMWSFDVSTRKTCAILISRHGIDSPELSVVQTLIALEAAKLHSPFLLAWATLVHLSNWMDKSTYIALTGIRQLEEVTGYGPYGAAKLSSEVPIGELTQASKNIGSVQVDLTNQTRHVAIGLAVASHLATRLSKIDSYATEPFKSRCRGELGAFYATVPSLQRNLSDSSAYVAYLQERVRSQSSVVYALMTHEDARINIRLAQASKELAEAAKKDGSSMKTIAIMTMLFLPGTYFASLWAVPSLNWDGQAGVVVQDNFWVYWAFTLPCTACVFAVWLVLHRWSGSLPRLPRLRWRRTATAATAGPGIAAYRPVPGQIPMTDYMRPVFQGSAPPIRALIPLLNREPALGPPPQEYKQQPGREGPGLSYHMLLQPTQGEFSAPPGY